MGDWPEQVPVVEVIVQAVVTAQIAAFILLSLLLLFSAPFLWGTVRRRRSFRCPLVRHEVEVEFEERLLLGFRRSVGVRSCSVFEPPTAIECQRRCVDSAFRRQWEPALPVLTRAGRS